MNSAFLCRLSRASLFGVLVIQASCGGGGGSEPAAPSPTATPLAAPSITAAPLAAIANDGASVSFTVNASGSEPLIYQWLRNGSPVSGATSNGYSLPSAQLTDNGAQFSVTVSNAAGGVTSAAVSLTVKPIIASLVTGLPTAVSIDEGVSYTWTVVPRGSQPISLQWLRDGAPIPGATGLSYKLDKLSYGDDGARIAAQLTNPAGTIESSATLLSASPAKAPTHLSACQTINQPGSYLLDADLSIGLPLDGLPCIRIKDTSNVLLDCAGHAIATGLRDQGSRALEILNVSQVAVRACRVSAAWTDIQNVKDLSFTNSVLSSTDPSVPSIVNVTNSERLRFDGNQLAGSYQQHYTHRATISNNRVTTVPVVVVAGLLISNYGSNNRLLGNELDGNWNASMKEWNGADDGIILTDEIDALVQDNTIRNVWDAGIEWVGDLNGAIIRRNRISNAAIYGIGGWYWSSVFNSQFSDNQVEQAPALFGLFRSFCLRAAGSDWQHVLPADTAIRFENNVFSGNVLTKPLTGSTSRASYFNFSFPFDSQNACSIVPGERKPTPAEVKLGNNIFKNNNFGSETGYPYFDGSLNGAGVIVDGGGNVCSVVKEVNYPLICNAK